MIIDEEFGVTHSPAGKARVWTRDGHLYQGQWHNGIVRIQLPDSRIVELHDFERPNDAVISDVGFTVIVDELSLGQMANALIFIRPDGTILKQIHFSVGLGKLSIDPKGELVFLSTAASESKDAELLCFEIHKGELRWRKPAPKPAAEVAVLPNERCILVGRPYKSCGRDYLLKLTFDGQVLERWPDSPYQALDFGEKEREAGKVSEAERWFQVVVKSDISPFYRAKAYRALGELAEDKGQPPVALDFYNKALELSPKIGVRKKITALSKVITG
jgi:hypothetical protein